MAGIGAFGGRPPRGRSVEVFRECPREPLDRRIVDTVGDKVGAPGAHADGEGGDDVSRLVPREVEILDPS